MQSALKCTANNAGWHNKAVQEIVRIPITVKHRGVDTLYAKGITTREIAATFKELYDADVSPALISKVTDAVMEQVVECQNKPLDAVYPIVYLDCIVLKVRQDSSVINKSVFLALGINIEGQKELPGICLAENVNASCRAVIHTG